MTDLQERFRELDRLDAPEMWPEVIHRGPRPSTDHPVSRRRRMGVAVVALSVAFAGLSLAVEAFHGGSPPVVAPTGSVSNGKIAYSRLSDGRYVIDTVNADGTSNATLIGVPGDAFHPAWSPDGHRILFDVQADGGQMQIFVAEDDGSGGSGLVELTNGPGWNYLPAWSPDGSKIAFVSARDGDDEIYVMNADGSGQTRLTESPNFDLHPSWAPDGGRIVFQSNRTGNNEIYSMNPDGSGVTQLTNDPAFDGAPAWSPDGQQIVFASDRDGPGLYTMDPDGTHVQRLTRDDQVGPLDPLWSPDGASIVYTTDADASGRELNIVIVDVATRSSQVVVSGATVGDLCCPSWQPVVAGV
jgi:Tol biopolymer transport system component